MSDAEKNIADLVEGGILRTLRTKGKKKTPYPCYKFGTTVDSLGAEGGEAGRPKKRD